jgi:hypothetical protein
VVLLAVSLYLLKQDVERFASAQSANQLSRVPAMARGRS